MRLHWIFGVLSSTFTTFAFPVLAQEAAWDVDAVRAYMDKVPASVSGGKVDPHWTDDGRLLFMRGDDMIAVSLETGTQSKLQSPCVNDLTDEAVRVFCKEQNSEAPAPKVVRRMFPMNGYDRRETTSPNKAYVVTLDGPDIVFKNLDTGETLLRTDDGTPTKRWFYGYDIWEASEDAWSDDGEKFVARSHETGAIAGIPRVDFLKAPTQVERFRYWARAGEPLPITRFSVFNLESQSRTDVKTGGDKNTFAFFIRWLPDNKRFAFIRYARDLRQQELIFANGETGETETILTRTVKQGWVKWPSGPVGIHFLEDDAGFLWRSDEDGYFHWYHHRMDGSRVRQVTQGKFSAQGIVAIPGETVFFMGGSNTARPYDQHLIRVELTGNNQRQLTRREGQHSAKPSPDAQHFIIHHESLAVAPSSFLIDANGKLLVKLDQAEIDKTFRSSWSEPEEFIADTADGAETIHGIIFKPHDFDASKRYPVIERIYGGMQSQVMQRGYPGANSSWPGGEYYNMIPYLNALGFVVVTMDAPGTPGRGRDYNLKTHGTWPDGIIADHATALRQISKSRPWMDMERVGIAGNSWGGLLAARAMTDAPDLYKASSMSVADVDISDGVHWIEWHLGTKADNPDGYAGKSAADLAKAMKGEFLIIAGMADVNVPVSNTMKLVGGLAEEGKRYELVLFPDTNHNHRNADGDASYAYAVNRIGAFFQSKLGGPQE